MFQEAIRPTADAVITDHLRNVFLGDTFVHVADWGVDQQIRDELSPLILLIKGYDNAVMKSEFSNPINRLGQATFGSVNRVTNNSRRGGVVMIDPRHPINVPVDPTVKDVIPNGPQLMNPRDIYRVGDVIYIVGHEQLVTFDGKDYHEERFPSSVFSTPHSLDYSSQRDLFVTANSGNDTIVWFTPHEPEIVQTWYALDHGYNLSIGVGTKTFRCFSDSDLAKTVPVGQDLEIVERGQVVDQPTAKQVSHVNSVIFHPKDPHSVYATIFGTKKVDDKGKRIEQPGSGGQVVMITERGNGVFDHRIVIEGLSNPHGFTYVGNNMYMLTNSTAGEILFYEEKEIGNLERIGVFDLSGLTGADNLCWVQNTTIDENYLIAINNTGRAIEVFDVARNLRSSVPIDDDTMVLHKAVTTKALEHQAMQLLFNSQV